MASSTYKITQSRKDVTPALFVVASGLQNLGAPVYGLEISQSMKDITGEKAVCVMKSEGVWRLTTQTKAERAQILLRGLTIRGHTITVLSTNPRLVNGEQTIRLNIGNVPYEVNDSDVMTALELLGLKFGSQLKYEFYRDEDKNPTDIKTGRRFISIAPPLKPLPDMVKVANKYRAFLQYNRKEVKVTGLKDNPGSDPSKNHNDGSNNAPWSWPPTGWRKPAVEHGQDPHSESEEDLSTLPSTAPYGWQPMPRHGFPPRPTVATQVVSESDTQLGTQVQANLGEGFWSTPKPKAQQEHQSSHFASDQPDLANENLDFSNTDTMLEDEQDFLNGTSLKTLCEDIGIVHIPIDHTHTKMMTTSAKPSNVIVNQTPLDGSNLDVALDIDTAHVQENSNELPTKSTCVEFGSSIEHNTEVVTACAKSSNVIVNQTPLDGSNLAVALDIDTAHVQENSNELPTKSTCVEFGSSIEHNTEVVTACAKSSNVIVNQTPLDGSNLAVALDIDTAHVQENSNELPTKSTCVEPGSSITEVNCKHVIQLSTSEASPFLDSLDASNFPFPSNDSWDSCAADNESDTHPLTPCPQNDHTVVERRMEISVSDVASPQIIIPQQDLVPGSQLTIDNFTSFKSRSRSLTKDAISKSRERSSSKRKVGPLKETPKGKRSTKNKKSPKQKTNQGSKTNEQDRVSKGTPSDGNTGGNTQSAEYFDYWLNKQVRTSPT